MYHISKRMEEVSNVTPAVYNKNNGVSICIPRMESTIRKSYIFKIFCNLKVGFIESITEIPFRGNPIYKRVIIRIKCNESECAKYIVDRFKEGKNVKIVHSMPWYWICVENRPIHKISGW